MDLKTSITFDRTPSETDLSNMRERGYKLLGGKDKGFVELKHLQGRTYALRLVTR
jgi:hypothetical protein